MFLPGDDAHISVQVKTAFFASYGLQGGVGGFVGEVLPQDAMLLQWTGFLQGPYDYDMDSDFGQCRDHCCGSPSRMNNKVGTIHPASGKGKILLMQA